MPARRLATVGAIAAVAALLAGCSGSGDGATADPSTNPIDAAMAAMWAGEDEEQYAADSARFQELIAQCMTDEGFEYTPQADPPETLEDSRPDDRDWVAEWGYGQVTSPYWEWLVDARGANTAYSGTLDGAERVAYEDALNGTAASYSLPLEEQGCWGASSYEVYGDDVFRLPENQPLLEAIDSFRSALPRDPMFAEIDAAWSDCMADAGYDDFTRQGDAETSIQNALQEYYNTLTGDIPAESPELDALHDQEIELALADLACRDETGYREAQRPLVQAAEGQFVADHREEFDALVLSAHEARPGE